MLISKCKKQLIFLNITKVRLADYAFDGCCRKMIRTSFKTSTENPTATRKCITYYDFPL